MKTSFIDYWTLAKSFKLGDIVTLWAPPAGTSVNVSGVVTSVLPGIGFVDVEFPWGNQRVSAEELLKVNNTYSKHPVTDYTGYDSWDKKHSKLASIYLKSQVQTLKLAQECKDRDLFEIDSYKIISTVMPNTPDHIIREAISKVYNKKALYWAAPGRKYRMNKGELNDGLPNCPTCDVNLSKTNYKKHTKLFICPECLFCIKPSDIEGLPESITDSGFGINPGDENELLDGLDSDIQEKEIFATWMQKLNNLSSAFKKTHGLKKSESLFDAIKNQLISLDKHQEIANLTDEDFDNLVSLETEWHLNKTASISPAQVSKILGSITLQDIYQSIKKGSASPIIAQQFLTDFKTKGLSKALFSLSAKTADGLFNRDIYNSLVDTLNKVSEG